MADATSTVRGLMAAEMTAVPAMVIRGGTSKGVYLRGRDLPADRSLWGPYLIDMFGARDTRQIDGIGGAMPTTSKCCIVEESARPDADVDYTFAQVGIGEERVYWDFNCGNLTPAVGTYAILAGLVPAVPGRTSVRVYQTNTRMLLTVDVPTGPDGSPLVAGDFSMAGVTGPGAPVTTDFSRAIGASLGGGLFPTGRRTDVITVPGVGEVTCSILDLANMCVFFRAEDVGLTGLEMPAQGPLGVAERFHAVRRAAQDLLGVDHATTTPWPVGFTAARDFTLYGGGDLAAADYDVAVRFAGIQPMRDTLHEAFPGTASCCTAVAAVAEGTVVHDLYPRRKEGSVLLAHPSGVSVVEAAAHEEGGRCVVDAVRIARTARPIMRGEVFVRKAEVERLCSVIPAEDRIRSAVPPAGSALG
ncbi:PrpF domain-containing protein [Actinacidiphila epipremni]|uniref:3-methylitaconate isomerase n=1 Tax=Actinacidiphila epipremni TaxID=2053013 RepID=A0ABX0ZVX9_9ACTN|nr:PrpF domain-containing protein [Actinacidiphila epipremni]NJP46827.1 3-methylitaconate isomerase [Actinacidiphila epipremni]